MVAETDGTTVLNAYYRGANGIMYADLNGTMTRYLKDAHGNVTGLANMSGTALNKTYTYDAFGVELNKDDSDTNPFRYCGEYYDDELDKIYLRARYYSPIQGRFMTEDPIRDGLNWYAYCGGNPVAFVDPSGLDDVLLREIMEKNEATVTANQHEGPFGIKWGLKSVTVSLNGVTKEYTSKDYRIVNGKAVIDSNVLMNDFGLEEEKSVHQAGDKFVREEDAVLAFGLKYQQRSKSERQEYGAVIDKDANGLYSFENVTNSTETAEKHGMRMLPNSIDQDPMRNKVELTLNNNSVAIVHTHWREDGSLNFSNPNDYFKGEQIQHIYLVNRKNEIYYSEKTTKKKNINGYHIGKKIFEMGE